MQIVDAHCHAGIGTGLTGPWDTSAPLAKFLRRSAKANISRIIVIPVFHEDSHQANVELARIVRSNPRRLIGFAGINTTTAKGKAGQIVKYAVERLGLRGLKVHRAEGRISREVCNVAKQFRLPVLYDVLGQPGPMDLIAAEYPDVSFILPHLGSFADDYRAHAQVIDLLVRRPNVFADTSGVRRFDYLVEAVRRAGSHKLIFGSDGPWLHPGLELEKIFQLGLQGESLANILGKNIMRLLARATIPQPNVSLRLQDMQPLSLDRLSTKS